MAVLVTGGAGYIGSHTAVALHDAGRDVVVVDNYANSSPRVIEALRALTSADLVAVEADLRDRDAMRRAFDIHGVDEVIHFAAHKAVGESVEKPLAYYDNNLGSTISLLEVMADAGVRRLVFSSSCTVYGQPAVIPVTEDAPTGAESPYGWTKYMSEQIIRDVAAGGGVEAVLLRYFNPVGAHPSGTIGEDPHGIPDNLVPFVMQVAVGRLPLLRVFGDDYDTPDGTCIRDYVHVMDVAEAHVAALDVLRDGLTGARPVNIGTGVGTSVLEIVAAAERAVGRPLPHEIVQRRAGDVARVWASTDAAAEVLGWRATRDLDTMLADHWNWQSRNPEGYGG